MDLQLFAPGSCEAVDSPMPHLAYSMAVHNDKTQSPTSEQLSVVLDPPKNVQSL